MRTIKAVFTLMFLFSQLQCSFAIGKPDIIKPDADTASLRPKFVFRPVKNAVSYQYKLKEIDSSTGEATKIEVDTVTATNQFRVTSTLIAGKYYRMIIRAIDSNSVKSDKEKLYFQAKDKYVLVRDAAFEGIDEGLSDYGQRYKMSLPQAYIKAAGGPYKANANVDLPDGAIITGFTSYWRSNDANYTLVEFFRQKPDFSETAESIATSNSDGVTIDTDSITVSTDLDSDKSTIDNDTYNYMIRLTLYNSHYFYKAKITYID